MNYKVLLFGNGFDANIDATILKYNDEILKYFKNFNYEINFDETVESILFYSQNRKYDDIDFYNAKESIELSINFIKNSQFLKNKINIEEFFLNDLKKFIDDNISEKYKDIVIYFISFSYFKRVRFLKNDKIKSHFSKIKNDSIENDYNILGTTNFTDSIHYLYIILKKENMRFYVTLHSNSKFLINLEINGSPGINSNSPNPQVNLYEKKLQMIFLKKLNIMLQNLLKKIIKKTKLL
ncbi:hypothetical protein [Spiroplasma gladiatoris]|nr:hypothetical protein [Spiroplasma gladiatoris]